MKRNGERTDRRDSGKSEKNKIISVVIPMACGTPLPWRLSMGRKIGILKKFNSVNFTSGDGEPLFFGRVRLRVQN